MAARSISETQRVRYLLGLSSPEEREHIESQYFEDDDAFQEMLAAEDDLIDAYARGELTDEERRRVEKNFVSSFGGSDRVQFARAFAGAISVSRSLRTGTLLHIFKIFQSPRLLRTATITAAIVFVALSAWLVIDRRRMTNELRELRAESAERDKPVETLQRSNEKEQKHPAEITGLFPEPQPDKPTHSRRRTIVTQQARHLPAVKNKREKFEIVEHKSRERFIDRSFTTFATTLESKNIKQLLTTTRGVVNLLTLQPGEHLDQANNGVDLEVPLNTYLLKPQHTSSNETIFIPNSLTWLRFQLALETAAAHDDYRVTIKTAAGRPVTSVDWIEPLMPNQTIIDTPAIATVDLPSGDCVLLLMAKEPDGSFVKVAEYSFKVIRY